MIYYCLLNEIKTIQPIKASSKEEVLGEIFLRYRMKPEIMEEAELNESIFHNLEEAGWTINLMIK